MEETEEKPEGFFTDSKQGGVYMSLLPKRYKKLKWKWCKYSGNTSVSYPEVSWSLNLEFITRFMKTIWTHALW